MTSGSSPRAAAAGDFDGDDSLELIVWDSELELFEVFRADFAGGLDPLETLSLEELCPTCERGGEPSTKVLLDAGDFDGEPATDLMLSFGSSVHFGLNPLTDESGWTAWSTFDGPVFQQVVLDLDGDDVDDAILVDSSTQTAVALLNRF